MTTYRFVPTNRDAAGDEHRAHEEGDPSASDGSSGSGSGCDASAPPGSSLTVIGGLAGQKVVGVGTRELAHRTHAVLDTVRDGTRLVVTRHREPRAVLIGVRDATEAMLLSQGRGRQVAPGVPDAGFRPIVLSARYELVVDPALRDRFRRVAPRDRGDLRRELLSNPLVPGEPARFVWAPSGRWLFVCSAPEAGTFAIHSLWRGRELERELIGDRLWDARARQRAGRSLHGRLYGRVRPRGSGGDDGGQRGGGTG